MNNIRTFLFAILVILVVTLIMCGCSYKKKERYANVYYNKDLDSTLTRPTFNSNLDPRNMNVRSDPYVYGGYIKGASPNVENLASYNKISSSHEGFGGVREGFNSVPSQETGNAVFRGDYVAGMNDAAQYVNYTSPSYNNGNGWAPAIGSGDSSYKSVGDDFANLVDGQKFQAAKQESAVQKYKASLSNKNPDTLKYQVPSDLLPAPDMRQALNRDPSDPSNFMYDRTIFAPLKKRNHNEADRFRGDLEIAPIKIGWFDSTQNPEIDLIRGYFGYFQDIEQYQDLQDISYEKSRGDLSEAGIQKMQAVSGAINQDMMKPSLKYAVPPKLDFGPLEKQYSAENPWYNTLTGQSKRSFEL